MLIMEAFTKENGKVALCGSTHKVGQLQTVFVINEIDPTPEALLEAYNKFMFNKIAVLTNDGNFYNLSITNGATLTTVKIDRRGKEKAREKILRISNKHQMFVTENGTTVMKPDDYDAMVNIGQYRGRAI